MTSERFGRELAGSGVTLVSGGAVGIDAAAHRGMVNVGTPDPRSGNMLLEQFSGANGELAAAMQYSIQWPNCDDPTRKDLLMNLGTEELSHLEVIETLARMHLNLMTANLEHR